MKYFMYCRKSTEERDRQLLSIESQKDELKKRFPNIEIVQIYEESKSAFKPYNRPIFNKILERIQKGEAQGIAAWDPSRLSRNPIDGSMIIHFLDTGVLKDLKFGSYHFDNSPEGKMMLAFALSQSKYSSDKLSKDVKRGMLKKCEQGWRPGMALVGYKNDYAGLKGEKKILPDSERFELVRKMWEMLLSQQYSVPQIYRIARDEWRLTTQRFRRVGGKPISLSTLYEIFTNPFYYGEFEWDGKWWKGSHQPMISQEEFDLAQFILGRKGRPRSQKHHFPFTGMIRCGHCGCVITADQKTKHIKSINKIKIYTYYHCTHRSEKIKCQEKAISDKNLEEQIKVLLDKITIPENLTHWTLKYLHLVNKKETKDRQSIQNSLQKSYSDCTKRIDNLLKLYIDPGNADHELLTEEEFKNQKQFLLKEKKKIETKLIDCGDRQNQWVELTEKTFNFATYARYWFEEGSLEDKKRIFQTLGQNFLLKDEKLTVELHKPFITIKDGLKKIDAPEPTFSPKQKAYISLKRSILESWSG
ncbi:MAG: resolvase domain-containing protein [Candidatus Peregrinibacteria bacterium GW2011_GWF2_39_17]|nr:MAG: resolvase domain-containing protein [Candidatus Peregrinibacteria bacterium GW2011_GWF2_39_17]HCW32027.1 hypothetical protein [Candidatus Peregrinibacteria bacterium]